MNNKELNVVISQPAPIFFGEYLINIFVKMKQVYWKKIKTLGTLDTLGTLFLEHE